MALDAAEKIIELTEHYNKGLTTVGDKWNHMISWAPGPWGSQRHQFEKFDVCRIFAEIVHGFEVRLLGA